MRFDVKEQRINFRIGNQIKRGYPMPKKETVVTVRLSQDEVDALDLLTVGQFSRSQVMRIVMQDFLAKNKREQKAFLTKRAFE